MGVTEGHAVHSLAKPPLQLEQELSHGSQLCVLVLTYMAAGQEVTHVLPCLMCVEVLQVAQSFSVPPEHVRQVSLHIRQRREESAYHPSGQTSRQLWACITGVSPAESHDVQLELLTSQVLQLLSHVSHVWPSLRKNWPTAHA